MLEDAEQLVDGVRAERVEHVGPVEGDPDRAVRLRPVVGQVGQVLEAGDGVPGVGSKISDTPRALMARRYRRWNPRIRAAGWSSGGMTLEGEYEPSPAVGPDQVEQYEASGGKEANILQGKRSGRSW